MSCQNPFRIKKSNGEIVSVPCRHCVGCTIQKIQNLRVYGLAEQTAQSLSGNSSSFIRLSYNDTNLPVIYNGELKRLGELIQNGKVPLDFTPTLLKSDFTKLMKRVRQDIARKYDGRKIKYIYCGEYGDEYNRPHYHIVLFGLSAKQAELVINNQWNYGFCTYLPLKAGAITYISKYMFHDVFGKEKYEKYHKLGIEAPFVYHSSNLGSSYLNKYHDDGNVSLLGNKYNFPSYYAKKYDIQNKPLTLEEVKKRKKDSVKRAKEYVIRERQRGIAIDDSSLNIKDSPKGYIEKLVKEVQNEK